MAPMTKTTPPITSDVPKKARLIARFGGLGFDIDVVNNDAESLFIGFMIGESHRCRMVADQIKLPFSYLFNLLDYARVYDLRRIDEPKRWQKFVLRLLSRLGDAPGGNHNRCPVTGARYRCRWKCGRLLRKSNHLPWETVRVLAKIERTFCITVEQVQLPRG